MSSLRQPYFSSVSKILEIQIEIAFRRRTAAERERDIRVNYSFIPLSNNTYCNCTKFTNKFLENTSFIEFQLHTFVKLKRLLRTNSIICSSFVINFLSKFYIILVKLKFFYSWNHSIVNLIRK